MPGLSIIEPPLRLDRELEVILTPSGYRHTGLKRAAPAVRVLAEVEPVQLGLKYHSMVCLDLFDALAMK
ncbi:MAG: hypothetical protein R6X02_22170 [Enhygromyxa sp.]